MRTKAKPNELQITRIYDAPVEAVWDAWTDPEKAAKWWGPRGFTLTNHSKDLRVGGHWHYTMHGPDGTDYPNKTKYFEVEEYRKLVYDHGANDEQGPLFRVTVTFEDLGDQTRMEMTMAFPSPEIAAQSKVFIKQVGGNATWDRLAEYLTEKRSNEHIFVINRSFEAPVEKMFSLWTDAKHIAQWLGPKDVTMEYMDDEIAEGCTTFFKMTYADGLSMYGKMHYVTIDAPHYLEYTQIFCDDKGNLSKHPMLPVYPDTMRTRIQFSPEEDGNSRVTVVWQPDGKVSPEKLQAFLEIRDSMTQGWNQSFDKIDAMLEK